MKASRSLRRSGPRRAPGPRPIGAGVFLVLALAAATAAAQDGELAPAGSIGLVVLEETPGISFSGGGRLTSGILVFTGVLDLSLVSRQTSRDRYGWDFFSCEDVATGRDVSWTRCPDPEVRTGVMLDAAFVSGIGTSVHPMVGAGYRLGSVSTPFGLVGLTGSFPNGYRWYGRFLIGGRRFLQLHFGVSLF